MQAKFVMVVKHISRQGVASVCLMSLNWCKTPRGRPEPSLSGSKQRVGGEQKYNENMKMSETLVSEIFCGGYGAYILE